MRYSYSDSAGNEARTRTPPGWRLAGPCALEGREAEGTEGLFCLLGPLRRLPLAFHLRACNAFSCRVAGGAVVWCMWCWRIHIHHGGTASAE